MTNATAATSNRPRAQGFIAPLILIAFLSFLTISYISSEANQFQLVSKYNSDTSVYDRIVQSIYPDGSVNVTMELRRGVEGLYYMRDDDNDTNEDDEVNSNDDDSSEFDSGSDVDPDIEDNPWAPSKISSKHVQQILSTEASKNADLLPSPACHPHFQLALPNGGFNNITKFKRIYLYHARKAGGSSMSQYFSRVAKTYGLDYKAREWGSMEEPGFGEKDTFYVAHLREPVDRSISHFKYQGRWHCKNLTKGEKIGFVPTEENANKLETWTETGGHRPCKCDKRGGAQRFWLGNCAVNCYTQWFSGLSCPAWNISLDEQYTVAKRRVLRYNLIVIVEKLRDPAYVDAIEQMFGVSGITERSVPYCEKPSHAANKKYPLVVQNDTLQRLHNLNSVDIGLYNELGACLHNSTSYNFPKWNPSRFDLNSFNWTEAKIKAKAAKEKKSNGRI